jgi:hypothetical protein
MLEPVEGRIKSALVDSENIVRQLAYPLSNGPTVHGLEGQDLQDEKVQGPLEQLV